MAFQIDRSWLIMITTGSLLSRRTNRRIRGQEADGAYSQGVYDEF